jgi:hypothetical protein
MKKKLLNIVLALTVVIAGFTAFSGTAKAEEIGLKWDVTYSKDGSKVESTFDAIDKDAISKVMPGDTLYYEVTYTNNYTKDATFYMHAGVAKALEEGMKGSGGAYSYEIFNNGESILDNKTVGGENEDVQGLMQVNKDDNAYFNLGSIKPGESGKIRVAVKLDGNTINNDYMADLATLSLNVRFGAEPTSDETDGGTRYETTTKHVVNRIVKVLNNGTEVVILDDDVPLAGPRTGDSILPIVMCGLALVLGLLMIVWYFMLTRNDRREEA